VHLSDNLFGTSKIRKCPPQLFPTDDLIIKLWNNLRIVSVAVMKARQAILGSTIIEFLYHDHNMRDSLIKFSPRKVTSTERVFLKKLSKSMEA
jgi:hypothetical protein